MQRRNPADWQKLIEEQQNSGKNAVDFCRERNVNPKYFSSRKNRLKNEKSAFVKAAVINRPTSAMTLHIQGVTLTLAPDTSARWLAQLIREIFA